MGDSATCFCIVTDRTSQFLGLNGESFVLRTCCQRKALVLFRMLSKRLLCTKTKTELYQCFPFFPLTSFQLTVSPLLRTKIVVVITVLTYYRICILDYKGFFLYAHKVNFFLVWPMVEDGVVSNSTLKTSTFSHGVV